MKMNKAGVKDVKKAGLDYTQPIMLNQFHKQENNFKYQIICLIQNKFNNNDVYGPL